jgi:GT2 family glycosyltransferase
MMDIIVPIFNRPDYTQFFLDRLLEVDHGTPIRPIIVDNGSRKRTVKVISEWESRAIDAGKFQGNPVIVNTGKNRGFAGGVNAGIKASSQDDDLVCILHNDTAPFDGWIAEMEDCLKAADEEVVAMVPRTNYANETVVCHEDTRSVFEGIKPPNEGRMTQEEISEILDNLYSSRDILGIIRDEYPRTSYSPEIASFCVLAKRSLFREYGSFDEEFWPRTYEDKFWFLKAQRDGLVCEMANWSWVHHFGNITSDGPGFCFPDMAKRNQALFDKKVQGLDEESIQEIKEGKTQESHPA